MIAKIIFITLIVLVGLFLVIPLVLDTLSPVNILQEDGGGQRAGVAAGRSLFISTDGGRQWVRIARTGERKSRFPERILELAFHPANPNLIYLGSQSAGLWKSEDGSSTWRKIVDPRGSLTSGSDVRRIRIAAANPNLVYLAVQEGDAGKILQSSDGGESFRVIYALPRGDAGILDLGVDPSDPRHLLAATEQGGILESEDGGQSWNALQWFGSAVVELGLNPANQNVLYALTAEGTFFQSADRGKNWQALDPAAEGKPQTQAAPYPPREGIFRPLHSTPERAVTDFTLDAAEPNHLYATTNQRQLFHSPDGGQTWERLEIVLPREAPALRNVRVHPRDSERIALTSGPQIHLSRNRGNRWTIQSVPTRSPIERLFLHPSNPDILFITLRR